MEIFAPIDEYPRVRVSNHGRIQSLRVIGRGGPEMWVDIKAHAPKGDYPRCCLCRDGKCKTVKIHRLVAKAFLSPVDGKNYVNHKDGNKGNNHADNLEWVSMSENAKHAWETGLRVKDVKPRMKKISPEQIPEVMRLLDSGMLQRDVGKIFGISQASVGYIKRVRSKHYSK